MTEPHRPGAGSVVTDAHGAERFDTAAPRLSKGIERQLTAFVAANLQGQPAGQSHHLTTVVDEQAMTDIADEGLGRNAGSTLAEIAGLVGEDALAEMLSVGQEVIAYLVATRPSAERRRRCWTRVRDGPSGNCSPKPVSPADLVIALVRPWILRAADDGLLEQFIS